MNGKQLELSVPGGVAHDVWFDVCSDGGSSPRLFAAKFGNGGPTVTANVAVSAPVWLRVGRVSFSPPLSVARAGVAGNTGSTAPARTAIVGYAFDTTTPILDEDAHVVTCPWRR